MRFARIRATAPSEYEERELEVRKNSIKNTRINGEVLRVLSDIIRQEIKDPRIHMMTSVTSVEVAPDR